MPMPRHRIPTIFNLSMVDVLCCALGCVILLWLLNLREVKEREDAIGRTGVELAQTRTDLDESRRREADLSDRLEKSEQNARTVTEERDQLRGEKDSALARLAELDRLLASLQIEKTSLEGRLAKKTKEHEDLTKDLAALTQRRDALEAVLKDRESLLKDKETSLHAAIKNVEDLTGRLRVADARFKQAQGQADLLPNLRDQLAGAETRAKSLEKEVSDRRSELAAAARTIQNLESAQEKLARDVSARAQDVSDADRRLAVLSKEKQSLLEQVERVRAEAENRFAGVALTGRRVVFLVDMSGSMELADEKTPAAGKWQETRETLAKVMRSLHGLEKFQVILFSDRVAYPLGNDGRWLDYNSRKSPEQLIQAMAAIKPKGGTNLHAAFEAAFRLRADGLDTIYLLSDGLPNMGLGLPTEPGKTLKEIERSEILAKQVRKTITTDWNRTLPNQPRVRINAIGFYYESPDVGAFLWALARENDGSFVGMSK